jgi:endothelin-converting enzyme/putative endopeptidase
MFPSPSITGAKSVKYAAPQWHAPGNYRELTVRNLDAWYSAFDVKPGQALYLDSTARVRV